MSINAVELLITGDVQGVGYRRTVAKIARRMKISGFVKNQKDGRVLIFAQGNLQQLNEFIDTVRINEPPIKVEDIEKKERKQVARYYTFIIKPGSMIEELQEGLGADEEQLRSLNNNFNDYRKEFTDYRGEFKEFAGRTDENFRTLGDKYGEISAKLTQVLETLERESTETRREMTRAVDRLSSLVDQYIKSAQEKD